MGLAYSPYQDAGKDDCRRVAAVALLVENGVRDSSTVVARGKQQIGCSG